MMSAASSGGLVERRLDRVDDLRDRLLERVTHFRSTGHRLRQTGQHVAPRTPVTFFQPCKSGTDLELDLFGRLLPDQEFVLR
jgi:hypothetical protein